MEGQVGCLLEQAAMERRGLALQVLHTGDQRLDRPAFGVERRIPAGEVVLDQLAQITVVVLVRDLLPRRKVEARLIEAAAQPLAILRDEPRDEAARDDGTYQQEPIDETPDE